MNRCVVVNMDEDCDGSVQVLRYWFPWLAREIDHAGFCGKRTGRHTTPKRATSAMAQRQWHVIAKHNLQDVELYGERGES